MLLRSTSNVYGALCIAIVGVAATIWLFSHLSEQADWRRRHRFELLTEQLVNDLSHRMESHSHVLKGARGLMVASERVTAEEFALFAESRELSTDFPGLSSVGLLAVDAAATAGQKLTLEYSHAATQQNGAWERFGREPEFVKAAEAAIDRGTWSMSAPLPWVDAAGTRVSVMYFMPVFARGDLPPTPDARRERVQGVLFAEVDVDRALAGMRIGVGELLHTEVFDMCDSCAELVCRVGGSAPAKTSRWREPLLYQEDLMIGGRRWRLQASPTAAFESTVDSVGPLVVGLAGVMLSLLVAGQFRSLLGGRQRAERLARSMTAELQLLARVAQRTTNMVIVTDANRRIVWVNEAFTRQTGYSPTEAAGRLPSDLLHTRLSPPDNLRKLDESVAAGVECRVQLTHQAKDGRVFLVDVEVQPLRDEHGRLNGFMSIETDVTDRVRQHEALVVAQGQMDTAAEITRTGWWELSGAGDRLEWSRVVREIHEVPEEYRPGLESAVAFYAPEARETIGACVTAALQHGRPFDVELPLITYRGAVRRVRAAGRAVMADGKVVKIVGAFQDITDLVAQREAAEAATRAKSAFLANMSHEIRTPMTAIMGYTELLAEQESDDKGCPQRREYVETIRRNGEHLLGILNDILDLSKIEARRMTVECVETRPWAILNEVHELMLVKARAKGLRLELAADTPIPEVIASDPVRVRQVLVNLVGNAIKFTEVGGVRVVVSYRGGGDGGGEMIVRVTDTGVGLSAEEVGRIFAPFAQADVSTTRRFGGSGLGLSICQRLAEMLGGKIAVESLPGRGSTFTFTFSAKPWGDCRLTTPAMGEVAAAVTAPSQRHTGAGPLEGVRVVFVEDGLDNQRLISLLLRRAGASVRHFVNGRVALEGVTADGTCEGELPGETGFDLVLTDMQMPEMDGYELARRLRAKGWRGPIIALTAHAMAGDREKCIDAGCDGYLCKPVDPRRLREACLESLARTAAAR